MTQGGTRPGTRKAAGYELTRRLEAKSIHQSAPPARRYKFVSEACCVFLVSSPEYEAVVQAASLTVGQFTVVPLPLAKRKFLFPDEFQNHSFDQITSCSRNTGEINFLSTAPVE